MLPYLPTEQLEWLKEELDGTTFPSVIFSHQCLKAGENGAILNAMEFKEAIKGRRSSVVACFSGHSHIDYAVKEDGVWYMHINSASNYWLGSKYACLGRYGSEIDEKYPSIRYVAPYSRSLYAIVELNERGAYIKGADGEFVGKSPDELGWYKDKGYDKASHPETEIKPYIEDRFLPFDL